MYERILVPTGPDPSRKAVLEHALDLADTYGARVHVLHVADLLDRGQYDEGEGPEEEAQAAVDQVREAAEAAGIETTGEIREGTPYEEVLATVEAHDIDLVVMGTHGKQGLTRVLLGSTAEEVLRRSPVPVLTVRG
jgi:nucleotide-binding universal stress UspA family protein